MNLTEIQRSQMIAALQAVRDGYRVDTGYGICYNADQYVREFFGNKRGRVDPYDVVRQMSVDWSGRTGKLDLVDERVPDAPVGSAYPILREYVGGDRVPLWEGSQLEQRLSLIDYLIERLVTA